MTQWQSFRSLAGSLNDSRFAKRFDSKILCRVIIKVVCNNRVVQVNWHLINVGAWHSEFLPFLIHHQIFVITEYLMLQSSRGSRAMESMVEENGSTVDPLSQSSQSGDATPAIATSVQSIDRTHQQQTHHLVASTSIVQLTLPPSGTTQVYRRLSCVSMSDNLFSLYFGACIYRLFVLYYVYRFSVM